MENMEDFCVSHNYIKETSSSSSSSAAAAATILLLRCRRRRRRRRRGSNSLKFHPKHATNKNKAKYIMKISHITVNIYDKTAASQENSD
jgi:hypothetical protein